MKRILVITGIGLATLCCCLLLVVYIWTGNSVKENISTAQERYPGTAENALIASLLDENNSTQYRTHKVIWTLGQIRSEKALPILRELYEDDPEGKTCYGRHDEVLCQYEIHKAIATIEGEALFSYASLND